MPTSRGDILCDYTVRNGVIQSPGKFEGEPMHVPYFYDGMLEGWGDTNGPATLIPIDDDERRAFPETLSPEDVAIVLWQDDNGFCNSRVFQSVDAAETFLAAFADEDEDEMTADDPDVASPADLEQDE
jgi:hypothetical protein